MMYKMANDLGPAGLCAAKTILQCDPNADVKVLDAVSTHIGLRECLKLN